MNRRKFLGFLGAGAVAGPAVAKNVLETTMPLSGGSAISGLTSIGDMTEFAYDMTATGCAVATKSNWRFDRIAELNRWISGEEQQERDMRVEVRAAELNIHALGSVSQASKVRMLANEIARIQRKQHVKNWVQELLHLEDDNQWK